MLDVWVVVAEVLFLPVPEPVIVEKAAIAPGSGPEGIVPGNDASQHQQRRPVLSLLIRDRNGIMEILYRRFRRCRHRLQPPVSNWYPGGRLDDDEPGHANREHYQRSAGHRLNIR